jgi:hypothetical protein
MARAEERGVHDGVDDIRGRQCAGVDDGDIALESAVADAARLAVEDDRAPFEAVLSSSNASCRLAKALLQDAPSGALTVAFALT